MIKEGLKNYFVSLKYIFTPLGTMFLGMMLGFSVLLPGVIAAVHTLVVGVKELASHVNLDFGLMFDYIWEAVQSLDWNDPLTAFETMISSQWLNDVMTRILQTILGTDFETFQTYIVELVAGFIGQVAACVLVFFVFWILGFIAGFFIIKFQIRRTVARRSLWKFILAYLINAVMSAALIVVCVLLSGMWKGSIYVSVVVSLLLVGTAELLQSYMLYGYKKVGLTAAVNVKNVGLYMLTNLLIFIISIAFTLAAMLINKLMGLFVGLAVIVIAFIVIGLNAESYVQSLADSETTEEN